ncbi:DUF2207 domain-containing protein [Tissierella creatinophila]|uniref:DUF2207 domain-containing protein n=1 Tax=Tissierella creatinophila DSM 6911 TaxID=1123403 RepID=A0A1U7M8U5_TISCR|nr:DUF2207 domain-containing protein [Tissierella creatinophila]OLS03706.1 hypothetical protein TICRE_02190 [Tissierella creatinophila DSM 6911]
MKKRFLLSVLILFTAIILFSPISFAQDDLNINRWLVDGTLLKSGDLKISEDITFNFNDDFNGVYRDIILKGTDGVKDVSISEMIDGKEVLYKQVKDAKKGDRDKFTSYIDGSNLELKIFSPSKDESKTFRLKYTLKNVALKHSDTGELYYKFLGKENETHIDYFSVNLHLPQFEKEKIKIFAHGPQEGKIYFSDETIKSEVTDVEGGEFIENRILFPREYIPLSENIGEKNFNSILKEEKAFAQKVEKEIEEKAKRKDLFSKISIYLGVLAAPLFMLLFYKFRRNEDVFEKMTSPYPDDITPAELSLFMNKVISPRAFLASLFQLSYKGYIDIKEIEGDKGSKEYEFKRIQKTPKDLKANEVFLLDWIFDSAQNDNTVTTLELEEYRNKNSTMFYRSQTQWNKLVREDLKSQDYYDPLAKKWGVSIIVLSLIWIVIAIITFVFESVYGLVPLVTGIGILIYGIVLIYSPNERGYIQANLWNDFKDQIQKKSKKNIDISDDKALIYAIALDLPMKNLNSFRNSVGNEYYPLGWGYLFFLTNKSGGSQFEDKFTNRFYGYAENSSSGSSGFGGGGGFTGGGGGGAGGGGAGGF